MCKYKSLGFTGLFSLHIEPPSYCNPRKNLTYERHIFNTRNQQAGENIDAYVTDLKNKTSLCEFSTLKDSLIRDRIVCGTRSDEVRARLLRDPDLTLVKAIDACRAAETSQTQLKGLTEEKPIDFVQKRGNFKPRQNPAKNGAAQQPPSFYWIMLPFLL